MDRTQLTAGLKDLAREIGFDLVGIAPAVSPPGYPALREWLDRGFAGEMHYLPRREAAYAHPQSVLPNVRSVVMTASNYKTADPPADRPNYGRVARYAWGQGDYHDALKAQLQQLADWLHLHVPDCRTRCAVDTAPLLERDFARLAGLGWFGKNTMLLNKRLGSFFFLGALLTDVELDPDPPHAAAHCGTCTRCLDICPTGAFPEPYVLDARKCIAYLTIETAEPMEAELRSGVGNWLFGCDLCQDVCPWNRKSPRSETSAFQPQPDLAPADAIALLGMTEPDFRARFQDSPLNRPGWTGLRRNAAVVLGNSGDAAAMPALAAALSDADPVVRGAAAWALGRFHTPQALEALESRSRIENDPLVQADIVAALRRLRETQAVPRASPTSS
jgi:epoxyqueuosine reductase